MCVGDYTWFGAGPVGAGELNSQCPLPASQFSTMCICSCNSHCVVLRIIPFRSPCPYPIPFWSCEYYMVWSEFRSGLSWWWTQLCWSGQTCMVSLHAAPESHSNLFVVWGAVGRGSHKTRGRGHREAGDRHSGSGRQSRTIQFDGSELCDWELDIPLHVLPLPEL